jgi:hypothetical protein
MEIINVQIQETIMRPVRTPVVLPMLALASVFFAACGGGGPEERTFDLEVKERALVAEEVVSVKQGDSLRLRWTTDEAVTVHVHGYDLETRVELGELTLLEFAADATGRFLIEGHGFGDLAETEHDEGEHHDEGDEIALGYVEVLPR